MTNTTSNVDTTSLNSTNNSNTTTIITLDSFKLIDVEFYGAISSKIFYPFCCLFVFCPFLHELPADSLLSQNLQKQYTSKGYQAKTIKLMNYFLSGCL
jgi:hypothetical protein